MIPRPNPLGASAQGKLNVMDVSVKDGSGGLPTAPPVSSGTTSAPPVAPPVGGAAQVQGTRIGRYVLDDAAVRQAGLNAQGAHAGGVAGGAGGGGGPLAAAPAEGPAHLQMQSGQTPQQQQQAIAHSPLQATGTGAGARVTASDMQQAGAPNPRYQCPDEFMAFTQAAVPNVASLQSKSRLPFAVSVTPLVQGAEVPLVNMGAVGIVRCKACRAYINPFVEFIEGGRRWRCNLCFSINDVPGAYFSPADGNGVRADVAKRPELSCGVVDFVAPAEYMVRPPMAPAYLFVLDVSYYAISSGMIVTAIRAIRETLQYLPGGERTRIGLMTFDSSVHFYSLSTDSPRVYVVGDIDDDAFPTPVPADHVLVNLAQRRGCLDKLLEKLERLYSPELAQTNQVAANAVMDTCLGPALHHAHEVGKQWGCRILCFTASLPKRGKAFSVSNREQEHAKLIGADGENQLFTPGPAAEAYKKLGVECSKSQVAVDIFSFAPYVDFATVGTLVQLTGGQLYYYGTDMTKSDADREKLFYDTFYSLTKEQVWEGVLRLRCSKGVTVVPTAIFGNYFIRSSDLLALPVCDAEKAFNFSLKVEESLTSVRRVSFQVALLYTTSSSERRIRVFSKCLPVTTSMADLFRTANSAVLADVMFKVAVKRAVEQKVAFAREALLNLTADILAVYKQSFTANVGTDLVIPESLKLLPLYVLGMLKNPILRIAIGERVDRRVFLMHTLNHMPVARTVRFVFPRIFNPVSGAAISKLSYGTILQESAGVAVLDNSFDIFVWVSQGSDPSLLAHLFAATAFDGVQTPALPRVDSELSTALHNLLTTLRASQPTWAPVTVIKEGDAKSVECVPWFVEDKMNLPALPSFPEFIRQLQGIVAKALGNK